MKIFVVTADNAPRHVTFCETEACEIFDTTVRSGRFRNASVMVVATYVHNTQVLQTATQYS